MTRKYKIAFVSSWNPDNKQSWSGTLYSMKRALELHGQVDWINVRSKILERVAVRLVWIYGFFVKRLTGQDYVWMRNIPLSHVRGYLIRSQLKKKNYDFVFAPAASNEIAFLNTDIPIIFVSDATFLAFNGLYHVSASLDDLVAVEANLAEERALERADVISFPSQWAVDTAISDYGLPATKVHLNRFGSNFRKLEANSVIKNLDVCRLFFLGIDWLRKGGDIVVESCDVLISRGIAVELTICGCELPAEYEREYITHIPFLDKNNAEDELRLVELFHDAHFFFMPSQGECYGMVYAEASSAALPSIACDVGGVASVVTSRNGVLLPRESKPEDYAKVIEDLFTDQEQYNQLSKSARLFYEECLDWSIWSQDIIDAFEALNTKKQA